MKILRRSNPPQFTEYGKYKLLLREDFRYCCAYCLTHERVFGALRHMTIDHFRPRSRFPHLSKDYSNLYYCCGECNTYKSDTWPSQAELGANLRFVDVCTDDPVHHFRYGDCEIIAMTPAAEFTVASLRLDRPALTERRKAVALRFSKLVDDLSHLTVVERRATEISNGMIDPLISSELAAVRDNVLGQLHELIFPEPLSI
jgi:hypothetical protein